MSKMVINFTNEENFKVIEQFCKQYHIQYQVLSNTPSLKGIDEANTTTKATVVEEPKSDAFPQYEFEHLGLISFCDEQLVVRNWESPIWYMYKKGNKYSTDADAKKAKDNARYATKKAIMTAGGVWNDELKAYKFETKKAYNAFKKAQSSK